MRGYLFGPYACSGETPTGRGHSSPFCWQICYAGCVQRMDRRLGGVSNREIVSFRFVSFVRACARSGCRVGFGLKRAGSAFPSSVFAQTVFHFPLSIPVGSIELWLVLVSSCEVQVISNESKRIQLRPSELKRDQVRPCETKRVQVSPSESN